MPYDPDDSNSAEPGELLDIIAEEADAAIVVLPTQDDSQKAQEVVIEMIANIATMKQRVDSGKVTPEESDDFARRCRKKLDELLGGDTASHDPLAMQPRGRKGNA